MSNRVIRSRRRKPPRLHLRQPRRLGGQQRWVILDSRPSGPRIEISTGAFADERALAEKAFIDYLANQQDRTLDTGWKGYRYVQKWIDRRGSSRLCFQRKGYPRVHLPTSIGSPEFVLAYTAALQAPPLRLSELPGGVITKRGQHPNAAVPLIGVYLLLLKSRIVYVGSSLNMPQRVGEHRSNGRPFDRVFYIATTAREREAFERVMIRAINPPQNRLGRNGEAAEPLQDKTVQGGSP